MRMDYLNQQETNKQNAYSSIIANIGSYDQNAINALASQYGFTDEQKANLTNALNSYTAKADTDKANAAYLEILDGIGRGNYDQNAINALKTQFKFDDTQKANLDNAYSSYYTKVEAEKTKAENEKKNAYYAQLYDMAGISYASSHIDELAKSYGLSDTQRERLKQRRIDVVKSYLNGIDYDKQDLDVLFDTSNPKEKAAYDEYYEKLKSKLANISDSEFFDSNGTPIDRATAEAIRASMIENGIDTTSIDNFISNYHDVATAGISFKRDPGKDSSGEDNKNIVLKKGDTKYRVQYNGNNYSSGSVKQAATMAGLKTGDVFMYQGSIYIVGSNGDCYGLEKRDHSYGEEWGALVKRLTEAKEKTHTTATITNPITTGLYKDRISPLDPSWDEWIKSKYGIESVIIS
jgi:hypothetical protein